MKVLAREKFNPIYLIAGDSLCVRFRENGWFGKQKTLCETTITADYAGAYDEAVLFATEFEGRTALGGLVLKQHD